MSWFDRWFGRHDHDDGGEAEATEVRQPIKYHTKKVKPKPKALKYVREEDDPDFIPAITDKCIAQLVGWKAASGHNEMMFNFHLNETAQMQFPDGSWSSATIDFVHLAREAIGTGGSVTLGAVEVASQELEGDHPVNGQGHTHPRGMGAFYSGTDRTDQHEDIQLQSQFFKQGERYFIVFGGTPALKIRRIRWWTNDEGKKEFRYCDTFVRNSDGILINSQPVYKYKAREYGGNTHSTLHLPGPEENDIVDDRREFLSPVKVLGLMLRDEFQWLKLTEHEELSFTMWLRGQYGAAIDYLPDLLGDQDMALTEAVNIVCVLTGNNYHATLKDPNTWGNLLQAKEE